MTSVFGALACVLLSMLSLQVLPSMAQAPDPALRGHGGPIRAIAVLNDKTVVTGGFDSAIIVWDIPSGAAKRVLRRHDGAVTALVALPNFVEEGCFASGGEDGLVAEWCVGKGLVSEAKQHAGPVTALSIGILPTTARAALLYSGSWDRAARVREVRRSGDLGTSQKLVAEHRAPINGVVADHLLQFTPEALHGTLRHWTLTTVTASYDGEVRLSTWWDEKLQRQRQFGVAFNGLAALRDGRLVLTAADGIVRVLNADLTPSFELALDDGPLTAIAVSPDGKTIAVAGMRTPVALIDVEARAVARRILGPGLPVWALAFSTDGRELFTGGADRALRRWIVATGLPSSEALSKPAETLKDAATEDGARVFRACIACHTIKPDDGHRAGPTLAGIMGRRIGTARGYDFSEALTRMDIVWTPETIAKLFEVGPNAYTPGTKMPEQRITDPEDRKALVEWLAKVTKP